MPYLVERSVCQIHNLFFYGLPHTIDNMFVDREKKLNHTIGIDSPFITFAVGLHIYRLGLLLLSPEKLSSLSKLRNFLFNLHLALLSEG